MQSSSRPPTEDGHLIAVDPEHDVSSSLNVHTSSSATLLRAKPLIPPLELDPDRLMRLNSDGTINIWVNDGSSAIPDTDDRDIGEFDDDNGALGDHHQGGFYPSEDDNDADNDAKADADADDVATGYAASSDGALMTYEDNSHSAYYYDVEEEDHHHHYNNHGRSSHNMMVMDDHHRHYHQPHHHAVRAAPFGGPPQAGVTLLRRNRGELGEDLQQLCVLTTSV